jgi:hypothetical protein
MAVNSFYFFTSGARSIRWCAREPLPAAHTCGPATSAARSAGPRRIGAILPPSQLLPGRREHDQDVSLSAAARVLDLGKPMKRLRTFIALAWVLPASALAQGAQPAPPSRLWIVAGGASGTLRGHCQECAQDFPFRSWRRPRRQCRLPSQSASGRRGRPAVDAVANESGRIRATAIDAVAQFRPWESKGFFVKGGAGMAFVRNWVRTIGPNPDDSKALAVVIGGGWEFNPKGPLGLQLFAMQHCRRSTARSPTSPATSGRWELPS